MKRIVTEAFTLNHPEGLTAFSVGDDLTGADAEHWYAQAHSKEVAETAKAETAAEKKARIKAEEAAKAEAEAAAAELAAQEAAAAAAAAAAAEADKK